MARGKKEETDNKEDIPELTVSENIGNGIMLNEDNGSDQAQETNNADVEPTVSEDVNEDITQNENKEENEKHDI